MRQYKPAKRSEYPPSEKMGEHLDEPLTFTGMQMAESEQYGEMLVAVSEEYGDMITFSAVLIKQFKEEEAKGFPFRAKIVRRKRYLTLEAVD